MSFNWDMMKLTAESVNYDDYSDYPLGFKKLDVDPHWPRSSTWIADSIEEDLVYDDTFQIPYPEYLFN